MEQVESEESTALFSSSSSCFIQAGVSNEFGAGRSMKRLTKVKKLILCARGIKTGNEEGTLNFICDHLFPEA